MSKKIISLILALGMIMGVAGAAQASYLQGDVLSFDGTSSDIQINFNRGSTLIHYDGDLQVETADKIALSGDQIKVMHNNITFNAAQSSAYGDPVIDFGQNSSVIREEGDGITMETNDKIKLVADEVRIDHNLLKFVSDSNYPIAKIDFGSGDSEIYEDGQLMIVTDNYLDVKPGTATRFGGGYGSTGVDITSTGNLSMDGDLTVGGSITGTATIATLSVTGNTTLGDAVDDDIVFEGYVASDMIPGTDDTYDIGSSDYEWQDLYVDGTAYLDDVTVTGTVTATGATLVGFGLSSADLSDVASIAMLDEAELRCWMRRRRSLGIGLTRPIPGPMMKLLMTLPLRTTCLWRVER